MLRHNKILWVIFVFVSTLLLGSHIAVAQSSDEQKQPSLYDRLGGLVPISVVVSDFIDVVVPDEILNLNPMVVGSTKSDIVVSSEK